MRPELVRFRNLSAVLACAGILAASSAQAATITIVNNDGVGEGFNDATPAAPVGGNPGVTIGQQRLAVFQHAANIWGALLPSTVEIRVNAVFNPQTCTATSAVLGSAGPTQIWSNFPGAPFNNFWYHVALANRLTFADLNPALNDINATFNSNLGLAGCGFTWYYGLDGNEGTATELLPVVLHELGHGLGFSTTTSGTTGNFNTGLPSIFDKFLYDNITGGHWDTMTAAQRVASAISCGKLAWDGPSAMAGASVTMGPKTLLRVHAPAPVVGDYDIGAASFGPSISAGTVTGDVVRYEDAVAPINDGCEAPPVNAAALAGKIALIDRGLCGFVIKVKNAQDAGAIGVIIADNTAGCPPAGLGGADPTITIPAVRITLPDGNLLKANLVGLNVSLTTDPGSLAGLDAGGRVRMNAPNPFQGGSSVSHWDPVLEPNVLMEPAINNSLSSTVDITLNHFADIGWLDAATSIAIAPGYINVGSEGVRIEWFAAGASDLSWSAERTTGDDQWTTIASPTLMGRSVLILQDANVLPGTDYGYRVIGRGNGETSTSEIVWVSTPDAAMQLALEGAQPNPAVGRNMNVAFTLPGVARARLELVNVAGRVLRSLDLSGYGPGRHAVNLGGDRSLPAGTYFLRLSQDGKSVAKPVVVID